MDFGQDGLARLDADTWSQIPESGRSSVPDAGRGMLGGRSLHDASVVAIQGQN
jgi:hypothetical protein